MAGIILGTDSFSEYDPNATYVKWKTDDPRQAPPDGRKGVSDCGRIRGYSLPA